MIFFTMANPVRYYLLSKGILAGTRLRKRKYYQYYGDAYTYEFPAGSGVKLNLKQIANQLTKRLLKIFERNDEGTFQYHASYQPQWEDSHFREHHLFYEFFHGDTGQGLGASHQTGWTALIVNLLLEMDEDQD
jgi:hypothetical protein